MISSQVLLVYYCSLIFAVLVSRYVLQHNLSYLGLFVLTEIKIGVQLSLTKSRPYYSQRQHIQYVLAFYGLSYNIVCACLSLHLILCSLIK